MKVPDRWFDYNNIARIYGTKFVAFKTPLSEKRYKSIPAEKQFIPIHVLQAFPNIKVIIDLTNTPRYYDGFEEFGKRGVKFIKLKVKGRTLPSENSYREFSDTVNNLVTEYPPDALVGVHCTHGVNRTGYFICRYMMEEQKMTLQEAVELFARHRGHPIERFVYIDGLRIVEKRLLRRGFYKRPDDRPSPYVHLNVRP